MSSDFDAAVQQAKLGAMKALAYGASHEINNPLANIAARAQSLLHDEPDRERRRALEAIHHQALRAHEMISDLMLFARPPKLQRAAVNLLAVVEEVVGELTEECRLRDIEVHVLAASELAAIDADCVQLAVAIKAVCTNAIEAIGRRGRLEIEIAAGSAAFGDGATIAIRNDGPGIPADALPNIFDPFFSGREAGRGLGFGLSKSWRIVTDHGGRITAQSPAGGGTVFTLELPRGAANPDA